MRPQFTTRMKQSISGAMARAVGNGAERWQVDDHVIKTVARRRKHSLHTLGGEQVSRVRDPLPLDRGEKAQSAV